MAQDTFKLGEIVYQDGKAFKVTKVNEAGQIMDASPVEEQANSPVIDKIRSGMTTMSDTVKDVGKQMQGMSLLPGAGPIGTGVSAIGSLLDPNNAGTVGGALGGAAGALGGPGMAILGAGAGSTLAAGTIGKKTIPEAATEGLINAGAEGIGFGLPHLMKAVAPSLKRGGIATTGHVLNPSQEVLDSMYKPGLADWQKRDMLTEQALESGLGRVGTREAAQNATAHGTDLRAIREAELEAAMKQGVKIDPKIIFKDVRGVMDDAKYQFSSAKPDEAALQKAIRDIMDNEVLTEQVTRNIPAKTAPAPGIGKSTAELMKKRGQDVPTVELSPEKNLVYRKVRSEIPVEDGQRFVTQENKNLSNKFGPDVNNSVVELDKSMRGNMNEAVRSKVPALADANDWLSEFIPLEQAFNESVRPLGSVVKLGEGRAVASKNPSFMIGGMMNRPSVTGRVGEGLYHSGKKLEANPNPMNIRQNVPNALRALMMTIFGGDK